MKLADDTRRPRRGCVRRTSQSRWNGQCRGRRLGALGLAFEHAVLARLGFLHPAGVGLRVGGLLLPCEFGAGPFDAVLGVARLTGGRRGAGLGSRARLARVVIGLCLDPPAGGIFLRLRSALFFEFALPLGAALPAIGIVERNLLATNIGQHGLPALPDTIEAIGDGKALLAGRFFLGLARTGRSALAAHARLLGAKVQARDPARAR